MDEDVVQPSAIQKNRLHQTMCILNWSIQGNNAQVSNTAMQCLRRFFVYLVAPTRKWRSGWVPSTHGADDWRAQSIHIYIQYPKYTHCKHHRCNSKKSINLSTVNCSTTPSAPEGPLPSWAIPCPSDPFGSLRIPSDPVGASAAPQTTEWASTAWGSSERCPKPRDWMRWVHNSAAWRWEENETTLETCDTCGFRWKNN